MSTGSHQPVTIHQYHYTATKHDAISNYLFWIQKSLKENGISGEIFASKITGLKPERVRPFQRAEMWNCDLILIHHSQGNPDLNDILKIEVPKAVIYNNITPEIYFRHDPYIAELCRLGKKQLQQLKKECVTGFGTSEYNLTDLREAGFSRVEKLPLLEISNLPTLTEKTFENPVKLLFVGRLARHKNQALLIKTFYYLKDRLPTGSSLTLIGSGDPIYTEYLKLLTAQLGLTKHVFIKGKVSSTELDTAYREATVFVCTSLHEGFCIPLVEAMKYSLPIFTLASEGVLETLGNAGLQFTTDKPEQIAAIFFKALCDPRILNELSKTSRERLLPLSLFHNSENLVEKIKSLVKNLQTTSPYQKSGLNAQT